jgi:hypothetical protein
MTLTMPALSRRARRRARRRLFRSDRPRRIDRHIDFFGRAAGAASPALAAGRRESAEAYCAVS